jgi:hypothetical protein
MITFFIFYLLSVWGFTHILVSSKILSGFRDWVTIKSEFFADLVNCYQCSSFWISILMYFFFTDLRLNTPCYEFIGIRLSLDFLLFGFIGSGLVSFMSVFLSLMIAKSKGDI